MITITMGTRPEIIKMAPIVQAARKLNMKPLVVFTGQHAHLALPLLKYFGIEPDISLNTMQQGQSLTQLSVRVLNEFDANVKKIENSDAILVQGDTTSAAMAAYWGFCHKIPVGHVEAGLRTYNLDSPFPEEANRQLISRIARWHFAPTQESQQNLLQEMTAESAVAVVGNTSIDALQIALSKADLPVCEDVSRLKEWKKASGRVVLITAHRRENLGKPLADLVKAVSQLHDSFPDALFIWPVHPNPEIRATLAPLLTLKRVSLCSPLDYHDFVWAMRLADLIITDSGGVQEEGLSMTAPILVFRENTERPEGIISGSSELVGNDPDLVIDRALFHLSNKTRTQGLNPYGDGHASEKILSFIAGHDNSYQMNEILNPPVLSGPQPENQH